MDLILNPFYILGATLSSTPDELTVLLEEKSASKDPEQCAQAYEVLTHPQQRLLAELSWLLLPNRDIEAIAVKRVLGILDSDYTGSQDFAMVESNYKLWLDSVEVFNQGALSRLIKTGSLKYINQINVAVTLSNRFRPRLAYDLSKHRLLDNQLVNFVSKVCYLLDLVDTSELTPFLSEQRAAANLPEVTEEEVHAAFALYKSYVLSHLYRLLDNLASWQISDILTQVVTAQVFQPELNSASNQVLAFYYSKAEAPILDLSHATYECFKQVYIARLYEMGEPVYNHYYQQTINFIEPLLQLCKPLDAYANRFNGQKLCVPIQEACRLLIDGFNDGGFVFSPDEKLALLTNLWTKIPLDKSPELQANFEEQIKNLKHWHSQNATLPCSIKLLDGLKFRINELTVEVNDIDYLLTDLRDVLIQPDKNKLVLKFADYRRLVLNIDLKAQSQAVADELLVHLKKFLSGRWWYCFKLGVPLKFCGLYLLDVGIKLSASAKAEIIPWSELSFDCSNPKSVEVKRQAATLGSKTIAKISIANGQNLMLSVLQEVVADKPQSISEVWSKVFTDVPQNLEFISHQGLETLPTPDFMLQKEAVDMQEGAATEDGLDEAATDAQQDAGEYFGQQDALYAQDSAEITDGAKVEQDVIQAGADEVKEQEKPL